jgi:hypothetical protein
MFISSYIIWLVHSNGRVFPSEYTRAGMDMMTGSRTTIHTFPLQETREVEDQTEQLSE